MDKAKLLVNQIKDADTVIVGGGSGMSNAAGMNFWYEASPIFMKGMEHFYNKYHFKGLFNGFYNRFDSEEEHWAFILQAVKMILSTPPQKPTYEYLKTLLNGKNFHIITTNQDTIFKQFFPEEKVSEIQGSWSFFQSSRPQTDKHLYPTSSFLDELLSQIKDYRLPESLIPKSKVDGAPLTPWARGPEFLEDKRYFEEYRKISEFLGQHKDDKVLFLEMGVGRMTPMFIQEPFWELTHYLPHAFYVNINPKDAVTNPEIQDQSLLIDEDINEVLKRAAQEINGGNND